MNIATLLLYADPVRDVKKVVRDQPDAYCCPGEVQLPKRGSEHWPRPETGSV